MRLFKNFLGQGIFGVCRKSSKHETGYIYLRTELQNFFGSRRNYGNTINFGRAIIFVRFNFNRCAVKFLEAAAKMNQDQAKRIMLIGMILRLLMVFVVLAVAAHISAQLFVASSICFVVFYVTALGVLVYNERR